jgi:hypothetical protein
MMRSNKVPNGRKEKRRACGYEAKEEYDNQRMLVMHEVVAQAGAAIRDAAIGEGKIELSKRGGEVNEEEAIEKTYGSVPGGVSVEAVRPRGIFT